MSDTIEVGDLIKFESSSLRPRYGVVASVGPRANCRTVSDDALWCLWGDTEDEALRIFDRKRPDLAGIDEKVVDLSYVSNVVNGRNSIKLVRKKIMESKRDRFDVILGGM